MKTEIKKEGNTLIVSMKGYLNFDTSLPLRHHLSQLIEPSHNEKPPQHIIFNFENLEFVGSSAISSFIQILKEFNLNAPSRPRYCHVKSEFRKLIKAFDEENIFDFYETQARAQESSPAQ